jgi:hypothetical protein
VTINGVETERHLEVVTAAGGYTVQSDDYIIEMNKTVAQITTITLPSSPDTSRSIIVKDAKGDADSFNITIDGNGNDIDGAATFVIDVAYGSVEIVFDGTAWSILSYYNTALPGGTVTTVSVASANGFAGSVANATTTPAITMSTTVTGVLEGNGTAISAAATTGSGSVVKQTTPTLITPVLGVASATSVNKVAITAPATSATLTIADGATLTASANATVSGTNTGDQTTSGTTNEITVTDGATSPVISIATDIDLGAKNSLEIPNSNSPVISVDGQIGVDNLVADFSHGFLKYYSGEAMGVVAMPVANFGSPVDGYVVTYNATSDEFELTTSGTGNISGNTGATDNAVLVADGVLGTDLKASPVVIAPTTGVISGTEGVTFDGTSSGTTALVATAAASGTLTLPAATDTLVGKATTDTLVNKTLQGVTLSGNMDADGNSIVDVANYTAASATTSSIRTNTDATDALLLQAYDVDGTAYTTFGTLTAGNTPTFDLADATTKAGAYIYRAGGTDVALADGGTGASLADPNADRIMFWDDSAGATTWLTVGSGLAITDTTIDSTVSGIGGNTGAVDNAVLRADGGGGSTLQTSPVTIADTTGVISGTQGVTFSGSTSGTTTLQPTAIAGTTTLTLPAATDTLIGKATSDVLTNKTFNTAGTGNVFQINGTGITATTGSGAVALATSPVFTTPNIGSATGSISGNAGTATALATPRAIGGVNFDGTAAITPTNIQPDSDTSDTTCFPLFVNAASGTAQQPKYNSSFGFNASTNALTATTFIGALTGNASTASSAETLTTPRTIGGVSFNGSANIVPQTIQSINEASDTTCFPLFISASGTQSLQPLNNANLTFNASTGALGATSFSGAGTGLTGTGASFTAGTVTTNANLTGDVTSSGNATTIGAGKVTEAMQVLADNTTNNVSTSKHGYMPKAANSATTYYDSLGTQTNPALNAVLTGYTSGAGTVAATDTILQAIQKLNGNTPTSGWTQIAQNTPTGATSVFSSIPSTYTDLMAIWSGVSFDTATRYMTAVFSHAGSGDNPSFHGIQIINNTVAAATAVASFASVTQAAAATCQGIIIYEDYRKDYGRYFAAQTGSTGATQSYMAITGIKTSTAGNFMDTLTFALNGSGNFDGSSTITLYGRK